MPFTKGHKLAKGRPWGAKNEKTIAKEKAREIFEQEQLKVWMDISKKQAKRSLVDDKAREYAINQVIGKPRETVEIEGEMKLKIDV